jgi:hypothetical protein
VRISLLPRAVFNCPPLRCPALRVPNKVTSSGRGLTFWLRFMHPSTERLLQRLSCVTTPINTRSCILTALCVLRCLLVEKQPSLCVLHHPRQSLFEIVTRHSTTRQDVPAMRSDRLKLQFLNPPSSVSFCYALIIASPASHLTERISGSVMHPSTSVLFANTKRLAPARRCVTCSSAMHC